MLIRKLDPENAETAVQMVKSFSGNDISLQYMKSFLSNPLNYLVIAEVEKEIAGFLLAHALERLKETESYKLFIYEIDVAENYRRRGVATALINYIRGVVKTKKMINAFVFTNHSNKAAVELYKSTGGRTVNDGDDLMFVYQE